MQSQDAQLLLRRFLAGECTSAEKELVESWFAELSEEQVDIAEPEAAHDRMLMKIRAELTPVRRMGWRKYAAAAAAVVIAATAGYLLWTRQPQQHEAQTIEAAPGSDKAILTLANGQRIVLDSSASGTLTTQGGSRITNQNGQLDYLPGGEAAKTAIASNTLTTPRGGQYKLILPDGTKVWLDAQSSITYPAAFAGNMRRVSITGQAYFEVVHDAKAPFEVEVRGQKIRDIGTAFNINAYADEPAMKVTLINGAVAVNEISLNAPGQQAEYSDGQTRKTPNANLESVLAWKNGLFYLTSADIATVMRQISRWYDVDVAFEKGIPAGHITGEVPRNTMLSNVLEVLQTSGVHFHVEGKTIYVTP